MEFYESLSVLSEVLSEAIKYVDIFNKKTITK